MSFPGQFFTVSVMLKISIKVKFKFNYSPMQTVRQMYREEKYAFRGNISLSIPTNLMRITLNMLAGETLLRNF